MLSTPATRLRLVLVGAAVTLAACGAGADPGAAASTVTATTTAPPSAELRVRCGTLELGHPDDLQLPDGPLDDAVIEALAEAVAQVGEEGDLFPAFDWSVALREPSQVLLFGRTRSGPGSQYAFAELMRDESDWHLAGWGGCSLVVEAAGYGPAAQVVLDPDVAPDPVSERLAVWIRERACANGEAPVDRAVIPSVSADDERVVITVLVEPVQGGADCPSNPWHPITVDLGEPLGDRRVFDGSTVPPRLRGWPPAPQTLNG